MRKQLLALALAAAVFVLTSTSVWAADTAVIPERILGKPNAPITMVEYASFTCSHCADFYNKVMPELEKRYIETGKLRVVYRDFPLDGIGLKAATLARCMPEAQYFPFIKALFGSFSNAVRDGANPDTVLVQYAQLGGLTEEKAKACLNDTKMMDAIAAARTEAMDKYGIQATPTFIINQGDEKLIGFRPLEDFVAVFDKILAKKK